MLHALCDIFVDKGGGGGRERRERNCFLTKDHPGKGKKTSQRIERRPCGINTWRKSKQGVAKQRVEMQ